MPPARAVSGRLVNYYERYWHDLYKIAYRRLPSEEDVKDVLQETFISLWKNIHHISVDENIGGYLYT